MSERLRKSGQQWFEKDVVFEDLIREGRIPEFQDAGNRTIVVLPPKGVKSGDDCIPTCGGNFEYVDPIDGQSKGLATSYEISNQAAIRLREIQNRVLEEINSITS